MCVSNVLYQQLKWLQVRHVSCLIINILNRVAEGEKVTKVANELGIGNSTMIDV